MDFKKYMHLARFGDNETQNIDLGECYIFPKLDGSNGCVWLKDGQLQAGSRNRHLSLEEDNQGFYDYILKQENILNYLNENPTHRLFGEWLCPHALRTYKETAWRKFYVFDVVVDKSEDEFEYLHYNIYKPLLEKHEILYVPAISVIKNGSYEQFVNQLKQNVFLIEDGKGVGEGIVAKNYSYKNRFGRTTWAKIVTTEFKEQHAKVHGASEIEGKKLVEEEIADKYVTTALVEKEHAKIESVDGWSSRFIPRLLNTVYHAIVTEETWNYVKEHKSPTIDFKRLQFFVYNKTKERKPELF